MAKRRTTTRNLGPLLTGVGKLLDSLKAVDGLPLRVQTQVRKVARLHRPIMALCHDLFAMRKPKPPYRRTTTSKGR